MYNCLQDCREGQYLCKMGNKCVKWDDLHIYFGEADGMDGLEKHLR